MSTRPPSATINDGIFQTSTVPPVESSNTSDDDLVLQMTTPQPPSTASNDAMLTPWPSASSNNVALKMCTPPPSTSSDDVVVQMGTLPPPLPPSATTNDAVSIRATPPHPAATTSSPATTLSLSTPSQRRPRRRSSRDDKSETIPPPYAWSTDHRAVVQTLNDLRAKRINTIPGDVQCKRCGRQYTIKFDLEHKFNEIAWYVATRKESMAHRAPKEWTNPTLPTCKFCGQENSAKPVIADKKRKINWLFLLLGQMLGCCTLEQLKYFCKHTKNHRTGAKDRVLYLAYLALCKQLDPTGPFDVGI